MKDGVRFLDLLFLISLICGVVFENEENEEKDKRKPTVVLSQPIKGSTHMIFRPKYQIYIHSRVFHPQNINNFFSS